MKFLLQVTSAATLLVLQFSQAAFAGPAPKSNVAAGFPQIPFTFIENQGQDDASVRFTGQGPEFKAWYQKNAVTLQEGQTAVRVGFVNGRLSSRIAGIDPTGARANYMRGLKRYPNLAIYAGVRYEGVWPGVAIDWKAIGGRVKAEYTVDPEANPDSILLEFDRDAEITAEGELSIHSERGDFVEEKPFLFQVVDGKQVPVGGGFRKLPNGWIGFWTGEYDRRLPLVVDPAILLSGYFGGTTQDAITAVGFDIYNNVVAVGWTSSSDLPAAGTVGKENNGGVDAFVASFAPNGGTLNWCTYLGGSGDDRAFALAIDGSRNIYLTGWTSSSNFPVSGAYQSRLSGTRDAFVAKLDAAGDSLLFSTYLGGSGVDVGYGIALDSANAPVIAGDTTSTNLPVTAGAYQPSARGGQDAFVAKLSAAGNTLVFMTYLGGASTDHAAAVKLDGSNNVFVGGSTYSTNFPAVSAAQPRSGGGQDGFLSKLSPTGSIMLFSTYLGGAGGSVGQPEEVNALAVDLLGNVIGGGITSSSNFPITAGALQTTFGGETDGFVTRYSNNGALLNSTYLGGYLSDGVNALALDYHGEVYVTGYTVSPNFPVQQAIQSLNNGVQNAFVVKLNTTLASIVFGTYLGGAGSDSGNAIAVDVQTSIIVAGQTNSPNFPTAASLQASLAAPLTAFLTKIAPAFTIGVDYVSIMVNDPWHVSWDTTATVFGSSGQLPIVGDWDGTGRKRIGVFSNGTWYLDINGDGYFDAGDKTVAWGQAGDIPVVGDWLGTGRIALGLYRSGSFILDLSGHLTGIPTGYGDVTYSNFGLATDTPVAADWSNSGTAKVGVFRNGQWLVDYSGTGSASKTYTYGQAGDVPVIGDWDSSGHWNKIGVYRNGTWILDYDGDNAFTIPVLNEMVIGFGTVGFIPLVY